MSGNIHISTNGIFKYSKIIKIQTFDLKALKIQYLPANENFDSISKNILPCICACMLGEMGPVGGPGLGPGGPPWGPPRARPCVYPTGLTGLCPGGPPLPKSEKI